MYQKAIRYTNLLSSILKGPQNMPPFSNTRPSKIYRNWDFWFENICAIWQPCKHWSWNAKKKLFESKLFRQQTRVAIWYIFKPKIPIWVNFGGPWNRIYWYMLCPSAIYIYGYFV
jgi:hypothetical protein